MVAHLEEIIQSGEIESTKAIKQFEKLIRVLRKAKRGSQHTILNTLGFIKIWMKHTAWAMAESTPGIGDAVTGFIKATEEASSQVLAGKEVVRANLLSDLDTEFPNIKIEDEDELPLALEYKAIQSDDSDETVRSNESEINNPDIIDVEAEPVPSSSPTVGEAPPTASA